MAQGHQVGQVYDAADIPDTERHLFFMNGDGKLALIADHIPTPPKPKEVNLIPVFFGIALATVLAFVAMFLPFNKEMSADEFAVLLKGDKIVVGLTDDTKRALADADKAQKAASKAVRIAETPVEIQNVNGLQDKLAALEKADSDSVDLAKKAMAEASKKPAVQYAHRPAATQSGDDAKVAALVRKVADLEARLARGGSSGGVHSSGNRTASGGCGVTFDGVLIQELPPRAGSTCAKDRELFVSMFMAQCQGKGGSFDADMACGKGLKL